MRNMFHMHYEYTKEDYEYIWQNGTFVLDANVLLNLYRYTEETRNELLQILQKFSGRLWIPHQVGLEYQSNRTTVILEQTDAFDKITQSLRESSSSVINELEEGFKKFKKRHPSINLDSLTTDIETHFNSLIQKIEHEKQLHPNLLAEDDVLKTISRLFDNKVGTYYSQETLNKIFDEGLERYKNKIPPGYKDEQDKKGKMKYYKDLSIKSEYGDLIVWKQIIDKAKDDNTSIVFITDDVKEDWWDKVRGRTIGPRKELINEFVFETDQKLIMYNTKRFMEYASEFLKENLNEKAIEEVRKLNEASKNEEKESLIRKVIRDKSQKLLKQLDDLEYRQQIGKNTSEGKYDFLKGIEWNPEYLAEEAKRLKELLNKEEHIEEESDDNKFSYISSYVLDQVHEEFSKYLIAGDTVSITMIDNIIKKILSKYMMPVSKIVIKEIKFELIRRGILREIFADDKIEYMLMPLKH